MNITPEDLRFIAIYNNIDQFPTLSDVADALGIAKKTVKNKAGAMRKRLESMEDMPNLISRRNPSDVPMSEDTSRFMADWGPEECIEELRRIAELDPTRKVSRTYFRNNSLISESTWNRYFGTFEEFLRQAGVKLTRQQHALERNIAKHVSVDHYRRISEERQNYGEKYLRENPRRFKTIITASDIHDVEADPFYLRVLIDTCRRVQPDVICLVGDICDLPEFGRWGVDPREWDVVGRIRFMHDNILQPLREACPGAQIDYVEGNHEARLLRQLADATPALRAVLSDLHGMTVGKLLGLDQFEINYIAQADLSAWTKREQTKELERNYKVYWDCFLAHHFPHARNMGLPGVNGHHHQHQVWPMYHPIYGAYEWHQLGAGHRRSASYCEGEKWHMGFAINNIDAHTRAVNTDYVQVTDMAVSGGKWYHRSDAEQVATAPRLMTAP